MDNIIKLNTIDEYNELFGLETMNPLVAVVDMTKATRMPEHFTLNYGIYALFLKDTKSCDIRYGRQPYDYQQGTVTSFAPGQVVETTIVPGSRPSACGLLFHPDLIKGTPLGREIHHYSFFSYSSNEALHLSDEERTIFTDCLRKIEMELDSPIDRFSKTLIANNIELILNYCMRFYSRQFVTRTASNKDVLSKFEALLHDYFNSNKPKEQGAAQREILCRAGVSVAQLFRRLGQERDRHDRPGLHTGSHHRHGQADAPGNRQDRKRDFL